MPGLSESGKCILSLELSNVQSSSAGLSRLSDRPQTEAEYSDSRSSVDLSPSYLVRVNHVFSASKLISNPIDSQIYTEINSV